MILVADSGSTKTDWVVSSDGIEVRRFETVGLNPFFTRADEAQEVLQASLNEAERTAIKEVYFYGAGCSSIGRKSIIASQIEQVCENASVSVDHDLKGAARALFGNKEGIACILGTGSNTCYYDGIEIVKNIPALGYALGDDGSGAHIGRELVRAYLYEELSEEVSRYILDELKLDKEVIFDRVYHKTNPNRFLASFAPIASKFKDRECVVKVLKEVFDSFISRLLLKYRDCPTNAVGIIGSIGVEFKDLIKPAIESAGFSLNIVERKPIDRLVMIHNSRNESH